MPLTANEYFKQGIDAIKNKDWDKAIIEFNEALTLEPNNIEYLQGQATALLRTKKYEAAIDAISTALLYNNQDSYSNYLKSAIYLAQQDSAHAISHLDIAIDNEPKCPHYHYAKGIALMHSMSWREATQYFANTIKIEPNYHRAASLLEDCNIEILGQIDEN